MPADNEAPWQLGTLALDRETGTVEVGAFSVRVVAVDGRVIRGPEDAEIATQLFRTLLMKTAEELAAWRYFGEDFKRHMARIGSPPDPRGYNERGES